MRRPAGNQHSGPTHKSSILAWLPTPGLRLPRHLSYLHVVWKFTLTSTKKQGQAHHPRIPSPWASTKHCLLMCHSHQIHESSELGTQWMLNKHFLMDQTTEYAPDHKYSIFPGGEGERNSSQQLKPWSHLPCFHGYNLEKSLNLLVDKVMGTWHCLSHLHTPHKRSWPKPSVTG